LDGFIFMSGTAASSIERGRLWDTLGVPWLVGAASSAEWAEPFSVAEEDEASEPSVSRAAWREGPFGSSLARICTRPVPSFCTNLRAAKYQ
jgi:hypothetical protein